MKNKIKESWEKIEMDPSSQQKLLSNILEKKENKSILKSSYAYAFALVLIILLVSIPYFIQRIENTNTTQTSSIVSGNVDENKKEGISFKEIEEYEKKENPPIQLDKTIIDIGQSIQEKNYYNGPACVQMVLRLHGIELSQEQLAEELNTSSFTGTEYEDIARVVNKYVFGKEDISENEFGYHLQIGAETNLLESRIIADINANDPVFIALDGNTLYEGSSQGNHLVIIVGYAKYKDTDTIAYYYFIDPWDMYRDEEYGGLKTVTPEDLKQSLLNNNEPAYIW